MRRVHGRARHRAPEAERAAHGHAWRRGAAGRVRLRDAQGRDQRRDARLGDQRRPTPTTCSARRWVRIPYPTIVRDFQRVIGDEAAAQIEARSKAGCPTSSSPASAAGRTRSGIFSRFIGEPSVRLVAVEAAGDGIETGPSRRGARRGQPGHHPRRANDAAPGRRRPGRGGALDLGRARLPGRRPAARGAGARKADWSCARSTDSQALAAMRQLAPCEGILPALESAHALAALPRPARGRRARQRRPGRACPAAATRIVGHLAVTRVTSATARLAAHRAGLRGGRGQTGGSRSCPTSWRATRIMATSERLAIAALDAGADLLEIGLPYSDPLADGVTLQRASTAALAGGADAGRVARPGRARGAGATGQAGAGDGLRQPVHGSARRRRRSPARWPRPEQPGRSWPT